LPMTRSNLAGVRITSNRSLLKLSIDTLADRRGNFFSFSTSRGLIMVPLLVNPNSRLGFSERSNPVTKSRNGLRKNASPRAQQNYVTGGRMRFTGAGGSLSIIGSAARYWFWLQYPQLMLQSTEDAYPRCVGFACMSERPSVNSRWASRRFAAEGAATS